ncbi:MAG TPA: selenocysteine-specific translation elongation factor [Nocardioidaceae bacterium]|nr:selenocysteine-specific translation elongation factor [Nocardioidaceae bacterium]
MQVVATAGHVDHGKSTLVKALTGTDPDRLADERKRGLSIELGYCWTELAGAGDVAFVDVPGHQRFITTTLSGVGPVPVAMLVVAADDPWMPQAAEHLRALDALGVAHGVFVVTRADLADPEPIRARARAELARTTLANAPSVVVSGRTGAGLDELRAVLAEVLRNVPVPDPDSDVRLWIDRRFHVHGAGTIVTGTLAAGTISVGDNLAIGDDLVRVRGLESLGRQRDRVSGVARVALDLGGRSPDTVRRGSALVTPAAFLATSLVDVRLTGDGRIPEQPVLHIGSAHTTTHTRPLGDGFARLRLEQPLPLRVHDRAILRDPGNRQIWGVEVLDPAPPPLARRGSATKRARTLGTYDGSADAELRQRGIVRTELLRRLGVRSEPLPAGTVRAAGWLIGPDGAADLRTRLAALVAEHSTPLEPGVSIAAAAHALGLPDPNLVGALVTEPLRLDRGRVVEESRELAPELAVPLAALRSALEDAPFAAPDADTLRRIGLDARTIAALHRDGHVVRLADGVVLLPDAENLAIKRLSELPQPFTVSAARRALETSRRVALPLLAHLDATGRTLRRPDDTRQVRPDA